MNLSIQHRFSLWAGLSLLAVVLVTALIGVWQFGNIKQSLAQHSQQATQQQVEAYLDVLASDTSAQFLVPLQRALHTAQTTAAAMQAMVSSDSASNRRTLALRVLEQTLANNPDFLGSYIAFEPNAFDGQDFLFANSPGSDSQGRFLPYTVRSANGLFSVENLAGLEDASQDENGVRAGEYYLCSKDSSRACVIDPFLYPVDGKDVLMTSLVAPVLKNGRFIGISGIDIEADFLQSVITRVGQRLYEGKGEALLVSPRGIIAGHSQQAELIGQNLKGLAPGLQEEIQQVSKQGESRLLQENGKFIVLSPFKLPGSERNWVTAIGVPEALALAAVSEQNQFLSQAQQRFIMTTTLFGLFLAALGVATVWWVARNSIRPLLDMTQLVASIAEGEGDLTQQLDIKRQDETGLLSTLLNTFISKLRNMIHQLLPLGGDVSQLSAEGRRISDETSEQMLQQQQLIEEMVSAVTEMAASAQQIAGNADRTSQFVDKANASSEAGAGLVQQTATSINEVSVSMHQSEAAMIELEKHSESIFEILSVIQGIAEQTNLLALNAAIEAARAGDKGRGFAVVADEVRALASRTQEATVDIHSKLNTLQKGSQDVSAAMNQSGKQVNETVKLAQAAESALLEIKEAIKEVTEMTFQIASATEEQSAVCEEVSNNLTRISHLVQRTTEGAQQLSRVGNDLDQAANGLQTRLTSFKV